MELTGEEVSFLLLKGLGRVIFSNDETGDEKSADTYFGGWIRLAQIDPHLSQTQGGCGDLEVRLS
eukprot:scaffold505682_cov19-Prasinocladus_malaysianus.AAC.1